MKEQNGQSPANKRVGFIIAACVLVLALGAMGVFLMNFILLDGTVYSRNTAVLNLSGSDIEDFSALGKLHKLEKVDLTHTSLRDLSVFDECPALKTVIIKDRSTPAEQCVHFYSLHPDAQIIGDVLLADQEFAYDTEALVIADITHEELLELSALRNLKNLDVSYCEVSDEDYDYLKERLPACDILRILTFNNKDYGSNVKTIKLSKDISDQELERVRYFPHLEVIDATAFTDIEQIEVLKEKFPQCRVKWSFTVLGVKTNSTVTTLDLRGKKLKLDKVREALESSREYFYDLRAVNMCGCGLSNEQMEDLGRQFPDLKFIWYVYIRDMPVRTDAKVLSTMYSPLKYTTKDFAPVFQYCTELVALDLSGNGFENLKGIENLRQLRALTVTHNPLRSIDGVEKLSELEYFEADGTYLTDVGSLGSLQNLQYVNLYGRIGSGIAVKDISPLENHPKLRLAVFDSAVSEGARNNFFHSNPDCTAEFAAVVKGNALYNKKWSGTSYRKALYQAYQKWMTVTDYDLVSGEYVFNAKTNQYKK